MGTADGAMDRATFHRDHQASATALAEQWLDKRSVLGAAWLGWVAGQLYQLSPPPYAAMVRRELQRLSGS